MQLQTAVCEQYNNCADRVETSQIAPQKRFTRKSLRVRCGGRGSLSADYSWKSRVSYEAFSDKAISANLTGFMPHKTRFVSGVKRHVSNKWEIKLREAPPCRRGASLLQLARVFTSFFGWKIIFKIYQFFSIFYLTKHGLFYKKLLILLKNRKNIITARAVRQSIRKIHPEW